MSTTTADNGTSSNQTGSAADKAKRKRGVKKDDTSSPTISMSVAGLTAPDASGVNAANPPPSRRSARLQNKGKNKTVLTKQPITKRLKKPDTDKTEDKPGDSKASTDNKDQDDKDKDNKDSKDKGKADNDADKKMDIEEDKQIKPKKVGKKPKDKASKPVGTKPAGAKPAATKRVKKDKSAQDSTQQNGAQPPTTTSSTS